MNADSFLEVIGLPGKAAFTLQVEQRPSRILAELLQSAASV
jgi:hypothetical protein